MVILLNPGCVYLWALASSPGSCLPGEYRGCATVSQCPPGIAIQVEEGKAFGCKWEVFSPQLNYAGKLSTQGVNVFRFLQNNSTPARKTLLPHL